MRMGVVILEEAKPALDQSSRVSYPLRRDPDLRVILLLRGLAWETRLSPGMQKRRREAGKGVRLRSLS
jgi:hypothetical protein